MTTEFFIEIAKLKPGIAFFRDDAFVDDSARTNLQQVFNQFSPTTSIKTCIWCMSPMKGTGFQGDVLFTDDK